MKLIDLSVSLVSGLPVDPPGLLVDILYKDHKYSVPEMLQFFPGATKEDLPDGMAWAVEHVNMTTHSGTHMDAPYHYHPTMNGGEPAWTIDQVPLEWFMGDGVVVDFSDKEDGYVATVEDFEAYFSMIGYEPKEGNILLLHTDAMEAWGTPAYLGKGCGVSRKATLWLIQQGIHVMGTDAWSWDAPLSMIAKEYAKSKDSSLIWQGHFAGIDAAYCHMEKLTNLDKLPKFGFKIICFPIKVEKAGGGWTRPVAVLD